MNYLKLREHEAFADGRNMGAIAGLIVGAMIMVGIHIALSMYADTKHEQAIATIKQADRLLLTECQALVTDLAEAPYEDVVSLKRNIVKTQGGIR